MDKDSDPIFKSLGVYGLPGTWKFRITSAIFFIRIAAGILWYSVMALVLGLAALLLLYLTIPVFF